MQKVQKNEVFGIFPLIKGSFACPKGHFSAWEVALPRRPPRGGTPPGDPPRGGSGTPPGDPPRGGTPRGGKKSQKPYFVLIYIDIV